MNPVSQKSILVVDDEPSIREFVERSLAYAGHAVTAVADGHAALDALSTQAFDLMLTDIVMPDLDGIALALKVAKDYPATKILLMSGYTHQRQRAHNLDVLANGVIEKPFTLEDITRRVRETLG